MKKYLVIVNPIKHSLSPKLHNYWIKENNINAIYEKKQLEESNIQEIISEIKNGKIEGINITVPFKKSVIPFLDELEYFAKIIWLSISLCCSIIDTLNLTSYSCIGSKLITAVNSVLWSGITSLLINNLETFCDIFFSLYDL